METSSEPVEKPVKQKIRWLHPTPGRLFVILLAVEIILLLTERWFPKGWAVLIAIASVGVTLILLLLWFVLSYLFHWRFQFSIRSLLVLTIAVAIPSSWLAVEIERASRQRETVEEILKMKGQVLLGSLRFGKDMELIQTSAPPEPIWLMNLLGSDFFEIVVSVDFTNLQISDNSLENIKELTQLQHLSLYNTGVTDAELKHLKGLAQLQKLELVNTQVTDDGLGNLEGLTKLEFLILVNTQVTDAGLRHLKGLTKLQDLLLQETKVTDAGVAELKKALPNVEVYR